MIFVVEENHISLRGAEEMLGFKIEVLTLQNLKLKNQSWLNLLDPLKAND